MLRTTPEHVMQTIGNIAAVALWAVAAFGIAWLMLHPQLIFGYP